MGLTLKYCSTLLKSQISQHTLFRKWIKFYNNLRKVFSDHPRLPECILFGGLLMGFSGEVE